MNRNKVRPETSAVRNKQMKDLSIFIVLISGAAVGTEVSRSSLESKQIIEYTSRICKILQFNANYNDKTNKNLTTGRQRKEEGLGGSDPKT
jgi:hypothetical protein